MIKQKIYNFFKGFLDIVTHFIRRVLYFTSKFIIFFVCLTIFVVTYERGKFGVVTRRKVKRIRKLTNFKLWVWKNFKWFIEFIHDSDYYIDLEKRLGRDGM